MRPRTEKKSVGLPASTQPGYLAILRHFIRLTISTGTFAFFTVSTSLFFAACSSSQDEQQILLDDTYNEGYFEALDCVKKKGGSARAAAEDCENE
jgi:hypothetical protein